jgi:hypothetical protein
MHAPPPVNNDSLYWRAAVLRGVLPIPSCTVSPVSSDIPLPGTRVSVQCTTTGSLLTGKIIEQNGNFSLIRYGDIHDDGGLCQWLPLQNQTYLVINAPAASSVTTLDHDSLDGQETLEGRQARKKIGSDRTGCRVVTQSGHDVSEVSELQAEKYSKGNKGNTSTQGVPSGNRDGRFDWPFLRRKRKPGENATALQRKKSKSNASADDFSQQQQMTGTKKQEKRLVTGRKTNRLMPDGCLKPRTTTKWCLGIGFLRPKGPKPKGFNRWNHKRGVWMPIKKPAELKRKFRPELLSNNALQNTDLTYGSPNELSASARQHPVGDQNASPSNARKVRLESKSAEKGGVLQQECVKNKSDNTFVEIDSARGIGAQKQRAEKDISVNATSGVASPTQRISSKHPERNILGGAPSPRQKKDLDKLFNGLSATDEVDRGQKTLHLLQETPYSNAIVTSMIATSVDRLKSHKQLGLLAEKVLSAWLMDKYASRWQSALKKHNVEDIKRMVRKFCDANRTTYSLPQMIARFDIQDLIEKSNTFLESKGEESEEISYLLGQRTTGEDSCLV